MLASAYISRAAGASGRSRRRALPEDPFRCPRPGRGAGVRCGAGIEYHDDLVGRGVPLGVAAARLRQAQRAGARREPRAPRGAGRHWTPRAAGGAKDAPPVMRICAVTSFPPTIAGVADYGAFLVEEFSRDPRVDHVTVLADRVGGAPDHERCGRVEVRRVWEHGRANIG